MQTVRGPGRSQEVEHPWAGGGGGGDAHPDGPCSFADGDPPPAGGAPGPVCLLAHGALGPARTRQDPPGPSRTGQPPLVNKHPAQQPAPCAVSLLWPRATRAALRGPLWASVSQLSTWVEAPWALPHDSASAEQGHAVRPLGWTCTCPASPPPAPASCPPALVFPGAGAGVALGAAAPHSVPCTASPTRQWGGVAQGFLEPSPWPLHGRACGQGALGPSPQPPLGTRA